MTKFQVKDLMVSLDDQKLDIMDCTIWTNFCKGTCPNYSCGCSANHTIVPCLMSVEFNYHTPDQERLPGDRELTELRTALQGLVNTGRLN